MWSIKLIHMLFLAGINHTLIQSVDFTVFSELCFIDNPKRQNVASKNKKRAECSFRPSLIHQKSDLQIIPGSY